MHKTEIVYCGFIDTISDLLYNKIKQKVIKSEESACMVKFHIFA